MHALFLLLAASVSSSDREAADDCWTEEVVGGVTTMVHRGYRQCVDLTEPREISGVWVNQFESSAFYENAQDATVHGSADRRVWLDFDAISVTPPEFEPQYGHAYQLKIVARSAKDMDHKPLQGYGHMGLSDGLVLVDRVVEWEDLGLIGVDDPKA